ncbi:MAG: CDP-alcohol phosphatidyltransferase family protein [Bacteroidetes bacterium]|nr:CDP-alcohol phosphatidyltransferase family protein [Bacteroidota bacterium]MBU2583970.1 CDP-alcohol phosphatidyltransferase family protein [Bacteroidota bacterium]
MVKINYSEIKKLPNILSSVRLLLILPVLILFTNFEANRSILIILAILAALLDNLDGYFARKYNEITELGKIIDPLADKLMVAVFGFGLVLNGAIPTWFFAIVLSRDLIIILFSLIFFSRVDKVQTSNFIGKLTVTLIGISFLVALFGLEPEDLFFSTLLVITSVVVVVSLIVYAHRSYINIKVR